MTGNVSEPKPGSDESQRPPGFRRAQWLMLLATMSCYLFYYTGRHGFGFAVPGLTEEFSFTKEEIGWISGGMLLAYGSGQFINGNLGDRFGGRVMMALGALLSTIACWVTSFGQSLSALALSWGLNGYFQSLGWAPGSRLISNWWSREERGKAFGFYVFAAGFSSVLTYVLCIWVLGQFGEWRYIFRYPVLLLALAGSAFFAVARNRPEDLGYPPHSSDPEPASGDGDEPALSRYRAALSNWRFLAACVSIGCESLCRYGLLLWVPLHFLGEGWREDPGNAWVTVSLPVGMAFGALTAGQLSDRLFGSNRSWPIGIYMTLAAVVTALIPVIPRDQTVLGLVVLFVSGFLVYGPQSSFWALCPDLLGVKRAGTGVGIMDACAYLFAGLGEPLIGRLIDVTGRTDTAFHVVAASALLSVGAIAFVRR